MQTFLFLSPSSVIAIVTMVVVGEHVDQQEINGCFWFP